MFNIPDGPRFSFNKFKVIDALFVAGLCVSLAIFSHIEIMPYLGMLWGLNNLALVGIAAMRLHEMLNNK